MLCDIKITLIFFGYGGGRNSATDWTKNGAKYRQKIGTKYLHHKNRHGNIGKISLIF